MIDRGAYDCVWRRIISQVETEGQSAQFTNSEENGFFHGTDFPLPNRGFVARMRPHSCSFIVESVESGHAALCDL
jgi:hypothetical protein